MIRLLMVCWVTAAFGSVFQRQGPLHLTGGTYIMKMRVDLSGFHENCRAFHNKTEGALAKISERAAQFALNQTIQAMYDACKRAEYWPTRWGTDRPRRQVGLLLAGAAFGGLVTGLWEAATDHSSHMQGELDRMKDELKSLATNAAHIADALDVNMRSLAQLTAIDAMASAAARNIHSLNAVSDALDVLVTSDRVSPKLVPPSSALRLWRAVVDDFQNQSFPPSPLPHTALYELPTTYRFSLDILEIAVHWPLIRQTYTLYHKVSHPIWLPGHPHPQIVGPVGYLAVAPDMRSFVRPSSDLASCTSIKTEPICPLVIDRSDWEGDCLAALFKGAIDAALRVCPTEPFLDTWAAEQTGQDDFNIIVTEQTSFSVICAGRKVREGQWQPGKHNVTVDRGCSVATAMFTLYPTAQWQQMLVVSPPTEWISMESARQALKKRSDKEHALREEAEAILQDINTIDDNQGGWSGLHLGGGGFLLALTAASAGAAAVFVIMQRRAKAAEAAAKNQEEPPL
jgi:hypothetical protein